jgi:hypothetical protein
MNGVIKVSSSAFPGPLDTHSISTFTEDTGSAGVDDSAWYSESIDAQPGINGNEALHTAVVYASDYAGDIVVQATLDNQATLTTEWADVATLTLDGTETTPVPINFNGVYSYLRFKATANPDGKISKILVRN